MAYTNTMHLRRSGLPDDSPPRRGDHFIYAGQKCLVVVNIYIDYGIPTDFRLGTAAPRENRRSHGQRFQDWQPESLPGRWVQHRPSSSDGPPFDRVWHEPCENEGVYGADA